MKMNNEPLSSDDHRFTSFSQGNEKYERADSKDFFINAEVLKRNTEVVICKNSEDIQLLKTNGVHNCLAIVESFGAYHIHALASSHVETVILALKVDVKNNNFVSEIALILEKLDIACKCMQLSAGISLKEELSLYEEEVWKNPRIQHLRELYINAKFINGVHHSIPYDEFCKWQYDLNIVGEIINFFINNHASKQPKYSQWDWYRRLYEFRIWICRNVKCPDEIDESTLKKYQIYMLTNTKNNHGRLLAESTQIERTKAVTELLGALEAHGIVSLKKSDIKKQNYIH